MLNNLGKTKWVSIMTTRLHIFPARKKNELSSQKKKYMYPRIGAALEG